MSAVDELVGPAVRGYLDAGLWLALDSEGEAVGEILSRTQVERDTELRVIEEVTDFLLGNSDDAVLYVSLRASEGRHEGEGPVAYAATCLGHDFYLTRNHHGAGFWDRGLGELGSRLSGAAQVYGDDVFVVEENGTVTSL